MNERTALFQLRSNSEPNALRRARDEDNAT
jgi:hypothetical protein